MLLKSDIDIQKTSLNMLNESLSSARALGVANL